MTPDRELFACNISRLSAATPRLMEERAVATLLIGMVIDGPPRPLLISLFPEMDDITLVGVLRKLADEIESGRVVDLDKIHEGN